MAHKEDGFDCWCLPSLIPENGWVIIVHREQIKTDIEP